MLNKRHSQQLSYYGNKTEFIQGLPKEEFLIGLAVQLYSIVSDGLEPLKQIEKIHDPKIREDVARDFFTKLANNTLTTVFNSQPMDPNLIFIAKSLIPRFLLKGSKDQLGPLPLLLVTIHHVYQAGKDCNYEELNKHPEIEILIAKARKAIIKEIKKIGSPSKNLIQIPGLSPETKNLLNSNLKKALGSNLSPQNAQAVSNIYSQMEKLIMPIVRYALENIIHPNSPSQTAENKINETLAKLLDQSNESVQALMAFNDNPDLQEDLLEDLVRKKGNILSSNAKSLLSNWEEIQKLQDLDEKKEMIKALFTEHMLLDWSKDILNIALTETGILPLLPPEIYSNTTFWNEIHKALIPVMNFAYETFENIRQEQIKAKAAMETIKNGKELYLETQHLLKGQLSKINPDNELTPFPIINNLFVELFSSTSENFAQRISSEDYVKQTVDFAVLVILQRLLIAVPELYINSNFALKVVTGELCVMQEHWTHPEEEKNLHNFFKSPDFTQFVTQKALTLLFPEGKKSLLLPDPVGEKVWIEINEIIEKNLGNFFAIIDDSTKRDEFILQFLEQQQTETMKQLIEEGIPPPVKPSIKKNEIGLSHSITREVSYLISLQTTLALKLQASEFSQNKPQILKTPIGFITGALASKGAKVATAATEYFAKEIVRLLHEENFSVLVRRLIWDLLTMLVDAKFPQQIERQQPSALKETLNKAIDDILVTTNLLPKVVIPKISDLITDKLVSLLSDKTVTSLLLEQVVKQNAAMDQERAV